MILGMINITLINIWYKWNEKKIQFYHSLIFIYPTQISLQSKTYKRNIQ